MNAWIARFTPRHQGLVGLLLSFCLALPQARAATIITLDRGLFSLRYDCDNRTALRFAYRLTADKGNAPRPRGFELDPSLPGHCQQQLSAASYDRVAKGWDRGHLVTSNHLDHNPRSIALTHRMTNIVPQWRSFNQGVWRQTEEIAECYRDLAPVQVYGGVLYNDPRNDHFLASHGIRTPDYFWKTLVTKDAAGRTQTLSWLFPNVPGLGPLDSYIVSIRALEKRIGKQAVGITLPYALKTRVATRSWPLPKNCQPG